MAASRRNERPASFLRAALYTSNLAASICVNTWAIWWFTAWQKKEKKQNKSISFNRLRLREIRFLRSRYVLIGCWQSNHPPPPRYLSGHTWLGLLTARVWPLPPLPARTDTFLAILQSQSAPFSRIQTVAQDRSLLLPRNNVPRNCELYSLQHIWQKRGCL